MGACLPGRGSPEASYSIGPARGAAQNRVRTGNHVAQLPPAPIASRVVSTEANQLRFLIVDDTEDIRDLMARMVVRQGHLADEAADGVEAVAALQENSYDFMLLDLTMPRMGGEEVVRWLNEHPECGVGLRVVVITAWAGERRAVLQELGVTSVLQKPLRTQQLRDLISETDLGTRS
jgi:CheY-like chemotaxis protein